MKFLCLHGIGTNNQIFKMQTAALRYEIADEHEYEFVEGCIPWPLAPGLESISNSDALENAFSYYDISDPENLRTALDQLEEYVQFEGPFDGVLGFSQGAGLAAMLLVRRHFQQAQPGSPFKCAIFLSPVSVYDPVAWEERREVKVLSVANAGTPVIKIPTAVICGEADDRKDEAEGLMSICDPKTLSVFVHEGGHEVPGISAKQGLAGTVRTIRRAIVSAELAS